MGFFTPDHASGEELTAAHNEGQAAANQMANASSVPEILGVPGGPTGTPFGNTQKGSEMQASFEQGRDNANKQR